MLGRGEYALLAARCSTVRKPNGDEERLERFDFGALPSASFHAGIAALRWAVSHAAALRVEIENDDTP
jgi:hypothetical protein